jgi:hypothetical protein
MIMSPERVGEREAERLAQTDKRKMGAGFDG